MLPQELIEQCRQRESGGLVEGFVAGKGPTDAKLILIGEAPGADEVAKGEPFVGQAGQQLEQWLQILGLTREEIFITNVFRSRPYNAKERLLKSGEKKISKSNRPPAKAEILAHAPLLDYEIDQVASCILVPLGNVPLKRLLGPDYTISQVHGCLISSRILRAVESSPSGIGTTSRIPPGYFFTEQSFSVFPLYHPAAIIYRRSLLEEIEKDIKALAELMRSDL